MILSFLIWSFWVNVNSLNREKGHERTTEFGGERMSLVLVLFFCFLFFRFFFDCIGIF